MPLTLTQVDSFTDRAYGGNPAAVMVLDRAPKESWMQAVAREMNLSETAFLTPGADGDWNLRWFTPRAEVDLCGHATLAAAHVLWESGTLPPGQAARFQTRSGLLTATRAGDWIELDFPAEYEEYCAAPLELTEALGVAMQYVGRNRFDYLIEVENREVLRRLEPRHSILESIAARGFIVTCPGDDEYDFYSRFFAPGLGIPEDSVTGSAHCCLGPFWANRLGKDTMVAYQASERGGVIRIRIEGNRVILGGQAVTVLRGELLQEME